MLNHALVVARKEIAESLRDLRSVVSSLFYALMGPLVVGLVSVANRGDARPASSATVLAGMMSIFALVAAFVGGMNVAMDTVAGERERRSLLPLLLNPLRRFDILLGKWLAVSLFSVAGLLLNLAGFAVVFVTSRMVLAVTLPYLLLALLLGVLPLPLFAASVQLLISTVCRSAKEAQTYLSLIVFLPMGIGMFLVFFPAGAAWCRFLPLAGQQLELQRLMDGKTLNLIQPSVVGCATAALAVLVLRIAARMLHRDAIVYGE
ncbi:MAG: ABC transporter permease subunit [Acidobacteriia bacterium]|nr:ABC transporter permease subunit [Terriglobia bacterium]